MHYINVSLELKGMECIPMLLGENFKCPALLNLLHIYHLQYIEIYVGLVYGI